DRHVISGESLSNFTVAAMAYPANHRDGLTARQAANNLLEELLIELRTHKYDEIYFIAHSLGGWIVKDILVHAPEIAERTRAVFMIAVPSPDARFTGVLSALFFARSITWHIITSLLTPEGSRYLLDVDEAWGDLLAGANPLIHVTQY